MKQKLRIVLYTLLTSTILWMSMIIIDFMRCQNMQKPLFTLKMIHQDYDDGYINQYDGLGYKYFEYRRVSVIKNNFVPFWIALK